MNQTAVIFAIDDDPVNLDILGEFLSCADYRLMTAQSGEAGLAVLAAQPQAVDVVLLDRMMPGMDGMEVLRRIKQDPLLQTLPVVMLTAAGEPEQVAEGISAGCFYYLTKPFDRRVLCEVVAAALRDRSCRSGMQEGMQRFRDLIDEERSRQHQATLAATFHYLNNALNQFQLVLLELQTKGFVEPDILNEIRQSIFKTAKEMREFGQLEHPSREHVEKFIKDHL